MRTHKPSPLEIRFVLLEEPMSKKTNEANNCSKDRSMFSSVSICFWFIATPYAYANLEDSPFLDRVAKMAK